MSWINEIVNGTTCSICGGHGFRAGPNGRLNSGLQPCCLSCFSLERHRIIYNIYRDNLLQLTNAYSCLHFAPDNSIKSEWFGLYEPSTYGGENSIDLQSIDRPDSTYDWVVCNHVLEHVEDDHKAMSEMLRVIKHTGIVQFAIPSPMYRESTNDWGKPDWSIHGHWRIYGKDFLKRFEGAISESNLLPVASVDPVTGYRDVIFFASKQPQAISQLRDLLSC